MARGKMEGHKTYLNVMFGKIVETVTENTQGAVSRINKNGKTVYEIHDDYIEGFVTDIRIQTHEQYGDSWILTINDGKEEYLLKFGYRSGYAMGFLYRAMNVDFDTPVKFVPYLIPQEDDRPDKAVMVLYQNNQKVESFFTKDNPNGLPELEKTKFKGKEMWDDTKRMSFLKKVIEERIMPKLQTLNIPSPIEATEKVYSEAHNDAEEIPSGNESPMVEQPSIDSYEDDLPF